MPVSKALPYNMLKWPVILPRHFLPRYRFFLNMHYFMPTYSFFIL